MRAVEAMLAVMASQFALKVSWDVLLTPVNYAIVAFFERREGVDAYDSGTDFTPFRAQV